MVIFFLLIVQLAQIMISFNQVIIKLLVPNALKILIIGIPFSFTINLGTLLAHTNTKNLIKNQPH